MSIMVESFTIALMTNRQYYKTYSKYRYQGWGQVQY